MSSVLQVQMLHDQDADDDLRQQFAFFELTPDEETEALLMVDNKRGDDASMMVVGMEEACSNNKNKHEAAAGDDENGIDVTVEDIHRVSYPCLSSSHS